jgi:predicted PurR-regulated permease PerM
MIRKYPFYIRSTIILFGLILLVYTLFNLKPILVPLAFALLIAVLLNPLTSFLEKRKLHKIVSIGIALIVGFIIISSFTYLISMQLSNFTDQLPAFKDKIDIFFKKSQHTIHEQFGISLKKQNQYISETETNMKPLLGATVGTLLESISMIILLPVYSFLFLYYKTLLLNFIYEIFAKENAKEVSVVLTQTKSAIQHYMYGLLLEALIVAILNSVALMILGVEYAILLGILGAILNILPFIGGILSVTLPVLVATVTQDGFQTQLWVIVCYLIIQFIDNHFLVPYIVSSRVKINALVSIVIVFLGGALWGISGMFLSIPLIGILKIIFDRIPELKPWGTLLGSEIPTRHKGQIWMRFRKASQV